MSVRLLVGDTRQILPTLPDASVQCVVTSPPYFGLRDYGVSGQIGLEQTPAEYVEQMVAVFREVRRVLRDDGTVWLNLGDSYASATKGTGGDGTTSGLMRDGRCEAGRNSMFKAVARQGHAPIKIDHGVKLKDLLGIPWRVAFALQADGWWLRSDIIWAKPNPMPESVTDRPTSSHEHVFLLTKRERYFYDADAVREAAEQPDRKRADSFGGKSHVERGQHSEGSVFTGGTTRNCRNVWTIATAPYADAHFATFPHELAERCIRAGTSERGCCAACGAPYVRQIDHKIVPGPKAAKRFIIDARDHAADAKDQGSNRQKDGHKPGYRSHNTTTGWSPACACGAAAVPCTVLDPFGGAGTTGVVADSLNRSAILIELNPDYARMADCRIHGPLFAGMGADVA